jgi:hypothetical protein
MNKLLIMLVSVLISGAATADPSQHKILKSDDASHEQAEKDFVQNEIQRFEALRKKILSRIFDDSASEEDGFESNFDSLLGQGFGGMIQSSSSGLKMNWTESDQFRILEIEIADPNIQLDFDINKSRVQIKGTATSTTEYGKSTSQFSHSYSVPDDVDGEKAQIEQLDKKIVIKFPFLSTDTKPKQPQQKPVSTPKLKRIQGGLPI